MPMVKSEGKVGDLFQEMIDAKKPVDSSQCSINSTDFLPEIKMKNDAQIFIPRVARKSLIVDLDRVFVDIMVVDDFKRLLTDKARTMLSGHVRRIQFGCLEFCVVVRPDTVTFFRQMITYYNVHIVTWMYKELVM